MIKNSLKLLFLVCVFGMQSIYAQTIVTGTITDATDGSTLPGVNVIVKGTTHGVSSDFDGNYSIELSDANVVLGFSFIGYADKEISVNGRSKINIMLEQSAESLDEVVVTGLGITKEKKALGYATSTVKADMIIETSPPDFASALYGKAAGVQISSTPGGSTSATNITIRGQASITGKSQPLIILDGVPIRDGEASNDNYWSDQRIRGNGLLDINPEDIENISILKGASAAALYGSEATNGVVLITTKGAKKGAQRISIDFSTSSTIDRVAYLPDYQNVRGPGYPVTLFEAGQDIAGFRYYDMDGDGTAETRGLIGTSLSFGPRFDGQPVLSWDDKIRPYEAQGGYEGLFQDAFSQRTNIAISNSSERSSIRFSYTRQDNEGISMNAKDTRNIFNLNTSFDWSDKINTQVTVNYVNQTITNRPYKVDRLINNFGGMMGRFDDASWYRAKYQTSDGYRYVTGNNASTTPDENIRSGSGYRDPILDYYWRLNKYNEVEASNRIMASMTNSWEILEGLRLRARLSTDFTTRNTTSERSTERPALFYTNPGGSFSMSSNTYIVNYGEILLSYEKAISEDFSFSVMAGYNATEESSSRLGRWTSGGLAVRDWFDMAASINTPGANSGRTSVVKDALLATAHFDFKGFLFLEGTIRRDRTSTMNPDNNAFTYPSVNTSFVFSEAFDLPDFFTYGQLRASYGKVGNYPGLYRANVAYSQNTLGDQGSGSVIYNTIPSNFGNDGIRPEEKTEYEIGFDLKFFNGRIGIDMAYYNAQIKDQILPLTLPSSSGASSILTNIGTLRNQGFEFVIDAVPVEIGDFRYNLILNFAKNTNKVEQLAPGLTEITHANWDGDAAKMISEVGQPMGDIYAHPILLDDNGNKIVDPNGLYRVDPNTYKKYGNAMPKWIGGMLNTFRYKNFSFTANLDFTYGGSIMPTGLNWMIGRGLTKESLKNMDAEHGGKTFYQDADGNRFLTDSNQGPNGEHVWDDGIVLDGVKADGTPNDYIVTNPEYYWQVYNWGGPQYSPNTRYELYIQENNYIKMREMSFRYEFSRKTLNRVGIDRLSLSVFGRNLFFIYRSIKDIDPEQITAGSRWNQNITNLANGPATKSYGIMLRASF